MVIVSRRARKSQQNATGKLTGTVATTKGEEKLGV